MAVGFRSAVHWLRTGSTGIRLEAGRSREERAAGVLFVLAVLLGLAAAWPRPIGSPLAQIAPVGELFVAGTSLAVAGIIGTVYAQASMGASWRIGVDPQERTTLVTRGVYRLSRNPIFTFMLIFAVGLVLMAPGLLAGGSLLMLYAGIDLQVRFVEEPYLKRVHGAEYEAYRAQVGRYVPGFRVGLR
jgi:protein-S-isoprenylcysteine O-methyltransferase Ste14